MFKGRPDGRERKPLSRVISFAAAALQPVSAPAQEVRSGVLKVRVNDAIAKPGGAVTLVLGTYAPHPISQGQVCLRVRWKTPPRPAQAAGMSQSTRLRPLTDFQGSEAFSPADDAVSETTLQQVGTEQVVMIQFSSESGTINSQEGPLAAMEFRLSDLVSVADTVSVTIDLNNSFVLDNEGELLAVLPRDGVIKVRPPDNR